MVPMMNTNEFDIDRAIVLLNAAISKQKNSPIILDMLSETVEYDDTECDGYCLIDDITTYLECGE